jgi:hypothetical protein
MPPSEAAVSASLHAPKGQGVVADTFNSLASPSLSKNHIGTASDLSGKPGRTNKEGSGDAMTRDEAYNIVCRAFDTTDQNGHFRTNPRMLVETFVSLGILKLDEPKNLKDRLRCVLEPPGYFRSPDDFMRALDAVHLKIVEK